MILSFLRGRIAPALIAALCLTGAPILLAGCAGQTASQVAAKVLTDVNLEASGLANALPGLKASGVVPAATLARAEVIVARIQAAAGNMSSTVTKEQAQSVVTQIETDVNALVSLLAGLPLPQPISGVLIAAQVLLPVIEVGVGLAVPAGASTGAMTPVEARMVLAAH